MAEDFNLSSLVIPGTYIRVRSEGLISAGGISSGNIGIAGKAASGTDKGTVLLSDYREAVAIFGRYDAWDDGDGKFNLVRALELLFANGARMIYARGMAEANNDYESAFAELVKEDVNILVSPEQTTAAAKTLIGGLAETLESQGKDVMAVVGTDKTAVADIIAQVSANKRLVLVAPGIQTRETLVALDGSVTVSDVTLPGTYAAAAVAGKLASLTAQTSLTNKTLPALAKLEQRFSYAQKVQLVTGNVLVLEERQGVRVVRGITTEGGAFTQITTRRIVDFAKAGVRKVGEPFIGRLNNERVRKALHGAIQGFLDTMIADEALTGYALEVTASRQDEIAGRALVNLMLQPTFSIDFLAVTIVLG